MDIESLPSEEWGYTHFPISVNYLNKYNNELTMMNGTIQRKCQKLDTIEDMIPLFNRKFEVKLNRMPSKVQIVPEKRELEFVFEEDYVKFVVPELRGHTIIEIL